MSLQSCKSTGFGVRGGLEPHLGHVLAGALCELSLPICKEGVSAAPASQGCWGDTDLAPG